MMRDNQRAHEERCAGSFFEWLAQNQGTEWEFQRAEERFPELANGTRWEFVASHPDEIQEWTAIEVKCLVFPDGLRAVSDWHKLIDDVNTKLDGQLCGKYWLARLPKYTFDQKERAALLDSLVQVIQKIAGDLATGDMREIGPEIASLFSGWPGDTRKQPTIDRAKPRLIYPPHELVLMKGSSPGSSIGMGVGPGMAFWVEPELNRAVQNILDKGQADTQLELAKRKGASKTALLLHDHIEFDSSLVAKAIGDSDGSSRVHMDEIYLISAFNEGQICRVWPWSD